VALSGFLPTILFTFLVQTFILENQDVVMDRRSEQQVYRRARGFFFPGKPFKWENYPLLFPV
jgi:hypothetical protein